METKTTDINNPGTTQLLNFCIDYKKKNVDWWGPNSIFEKTHEIIISGLSYSPSESIRPGDPGLNINDTHLL